jgi:glycosyltransferase involved in cell wall biosynthesis
MRSVLYIGADTPWSGGAGYLARQDGFLRALAEVASLHLVLFDTGQSSDTPPPFDCDVTRIARPRRNAETKWSEMICDSFSPTPRMFRGLDVQPARRQVREILASRHFDAVFAYRIDFAHFAGVLNRADVLPLFLDVDDPEHVRNRRRIEATTGGRGDLRTRWDLVKLRRFEQRAVANAAASFVCQEQDRLALGGIPAVAPNCVDVPEPAPPRRVDRPVVAFVGNFAGPVKTPNTDALLWLLNDVWPAVRRAVPDAELHVIGRTGDAARTRLASPPPGVRAFGFVEDLAAAYASAAVAVAPIRFGTGTRVKILEAFAHACPVVSTPVGCEGIEAADDREVLLADTADDFAARCVRLLTDPAARERLGMAGRALAATRYNRRVQHDRLVETFRRLLRSPASAAGNSGQGRGEALPPPALESGRPARRH